MYSKSSNPMPDAQFEAFVSELERSLKARYDVCQDFAATPSSILLAVLNAVADARRKAEEGK